METPRQTRKRKAPPSGPTENSEEKIRKMAAEGTPTKKPQTAGANGVQKEAAKASDGSKASKGQKRKRVEIADSGDDSEEYPE